MSKVVLNGKVELNGKVALITGANSGIGRVTARQLALQGYHVFLACRSEERTEPVLREIEQLSGGTAKADFIPLDLGDLQSVRLCAENFLARGLGLHVLICNAGLAGQRGLTPSGFELAFGTCHMGHFLLIQLLLEKLKASAPARIVLVSSKAHYYARDIDFDRLRQRTRSVTGVPEYAVAKLANLLTAKELARRLEGTGVTTYALHPGVVGTNIWRKIPSPLAWIFKRFMLDEERGAATTLYCATDPELAHQSGLYYDECRIAKSSSVAQNPALAAKLWKYSEGWLASVDTLSAQTA